MALFDDPLFLELIIGMMFISLVLEFGFIIFFKLGGYPIALWRIFRISFFFHGFVEPDGEITIHQHKRSIIENNPALEDMIPHFTCKERLKPGMYLIDKANAGRRIGRDFYINRPGQSAPIPIVTGYKDSIISAESLDRAFHIKIVDELRNISEQREKKRKLPIIKLMFGAIFLGVGVYIIYYGVVLLAHKP